MTRRKLPRLAGNRQLGHAVIEILTKAVIALLPVLTGVLVLLKLDIHRLIGQHLLGRVFVAGGLLAVVSYFFHGALLDATNLSFSTYARGVAPVLEESLKAAVVVWLFRRDRVGFQTDAAIIGFTIGAGFSLVENLYYLYHISDAHYATWIVRGFGTAIMHGGCTAIFAVISQILTERHLKMNPLWYLPGWIVAILFHAIFNQFPVSPVLSTVVTLLIIPTLLFLLFERNEVTIHNFLEQDFDAHHRLLRQLLHGEPSGCETGRFLMDVERQFEPPTSEHIRLYVHLHTELVLSAEGVLLAREYGFDVTVADEAHHKIRELHRLEREIGTAGMHVLNPHIQLSTHEFWIIHRFEDELAETA